METVNVLRCRSRALSSRSITLIAITIAIALVAATAAQAALREYRVEFQPSPSPSAAGHLLHVGTQSGVYETTFDLGNPPASGGSVIYSVDFEDALDLFVAMRTYDAQGGVSAYSNELRVSAVVPPPVASPPVVPEPPTTGDDGASGPSTGSGGSGQGVPALDHGDIVLGLTTTGMGRMDQFVATGNRLYLGFDSLSSTGEVRPARCDLDGDGDQDIVVGYDDQSAGVVAVLIVEQGRIFGTQSILAGTAAYRSAAGMTYPACGDLDGDGHAEIAIGFGPEMNGFVQVLDDMRTGFAPIQSSNSSPTGMIDILTQGSRMAPLFPAIGDIDGDGIGELVVGSGAGSSVGIVILDDWIRDFEPHPSTESHKGHIQPMPSDWFSGKRDVARRPAVGDVDGDGWDEIVVSFGQGSRGQIMILDDGRAGYRRYGGPTDRTIVAGRDSYRLIDGETVVGLADIDRDSRDEIVVGFFRRGGGELQVFDDQVADYAPMLRLDGFVGGTSAGWVIAPSPRDAP